MLHLQNAFELKQIRTDCTTLTIIFIEWFVVRHPEPNSNWQWLTCNYILPNYTCTCFLPFGWFLSRKGCCQHMLSQNDLSYNQETHKLINLSSSNRYNCSYFMTHPIVWNFLLVFCGLSNDRLHGGCYFSEKNISAIKILNCACTSVTGSLTWHNNLTRSKLMSAILLKLVSH